MGALLQSLFKTKKKKRKKKESDDKITKVRTFSFQGLRKKKKLKLLFE